jgi:hypothetical protein
MYSCDDLRSLHNLRSWWWKEVRESAVNLTTVVVLVLGNKSDKCVDDRALSEPLARLLDDIFKDTARQPVHMRLSALKDKSVMPVLEAVASQCASVPSVKATKKTPLPSTIKLNDETPTTSWCYR